LKRDLIVAVIAVALIFAAMFGVAQVRNPVTHTPSHPYVAEEKVALAPGVVGHVVLHVNGEGITEEEFNTAFSTLQPEEQQQFASAQGKRLFAEQLVRLKILEQEARQKGLDKDPKIASELALTRGRLLASAAASKLVPKPDEQAVRKFYEDNKNQLVTLDLYGIVIAAQGSSIPPRNGGQPPTEEAAKQKAAQLADQLRKGADIGPLAKQFSDEPVSAANGGFLGTFDPQSVPREVMALNTGDVFGPVPSPRGVVVFKAGKRRVQPLDGELKERIEQGVRQQLTVKRIEQMRKLAKVEFDPGFFPPGRNLRDGFAPSATP